MKEKYFKPFMEYIPFKETVSTATSNGTGTPDLNDDDVVDYPGLY